jgi:hypothetical protein
MAPYVLKEDELIVFMDFLKSLTVPTKYYSAPLKHVAKKKLSAVKAMSHESCEPWIIIQQIVEL